MGGFKARNSLLRGIHRPFGEGCPPTQANSAAPNGKSSSSSLTSIAEADSSDPSADADRRRRSGAVARSSMRCSITTMLTMYSNLEERLMLLFDVVKTYKTWYQARKAQLRTFEIDFHNAVIRNLGRSGRLHKSFHICDLVQIERGSVGGCGAVVGSGDNACKSVVLRFSNGNHAYALTFQSNDQHAAAPEVQAELFYQLLTAMLHEHRSIGRIDRGPTVTNAVSDGQVGSICTSVHSSTHACVPIRPPYTSTTFAVYVCVSCQVLRGGATTDTKTTACRTRAQAD